MANLQNELAQVQHISGELHTNAHAKIGMVVGRFNSFVVESLVSGAIDTLLRHGIAGSNITVVRVPGAWEIPLAVARMAQTDKFDAIIGLGAVIRGSTPHFDYVCAEVSKGVAQTSLKFNIPVAFGVLTTENIEQAIERAGTKAGNKGFDAAITAIEMANLMRVL